MARERDAMFVAAVVFGEGAGGTGFLGVADGLQTLFAGVLVGVQQMLVALAFGSSRLTTTDWDAGTYRQYLDSVGLPCSLFSGALASSVAALCWPSSR